MRAAFEHESHINLHRYPIQMDWKDEVLTLEGDVENIAAKKLGMELAAAIPGVRGIVDRLHVVSATLMGDGAILDVVRNALIQEPALQHCTLRVKAKSGSVVNYSQGKKLEKGDLFELPCDILIPAARPDCIHKDNVENIQAKLILQGANIPATAEAETRLHQRGVLIVPDFIANAGGVTCASVEYHGGNEAQALQDISQKIRHNTQEVLQRSQREGIEPRKGAVDLSRERVLQVMTLGLAGKCRE